MRCVLNERLPENPQLPISWVTEHQHLLLIPTFPAHKIL